MPDRNICLDAFALPDGWVVIDRCVDGEHDRRHLMALGISKEKVKLASRSRKGYWRMSRNSIIQRTLTNRWLHEQGVPNMKAKWIALHYPDPVQEV